MKEFGRQAYDNVAYINFDSNPRMKDLFASDLNTDRLIMGLELYVGHKIDPKKTLLIFDEVQEVPRALTSLKYFYENAPQYHIICAISFSGIAFVAAAKDKVVPVEVKAETNLKAKSLKTFQEKYDPKLSIRVSLADYKKEDRLLNLPLYAIENIEAECIDQ